MTKKKLELTQRSDAVLAAFYFDGNEFTAEGDQNVYWLGRKDRFTELGFDSDPYISASRTDEELVAQRHDSERRNSTVDDLAAGLRGVYDLGRSDAEVFEATMTPEERHRLTKHVPGPLRNLNRETLKQVIQESIDRHSNGHPSLDDITDSVITHLASLDHAETHNEWGCTWDSRTDPVRMAEDDAREFAKAPGIKLHTRTVRNSQWTEVTL